jgi:hypothetical protein
MDNVQNCDSYINIPSQTYRSYQPKVFQNYHIACDLIQVVEMQTVVLHSQNTREPFKKFENTREKTGV